MGNIKLSRKRFLTWGMSVTSLLSIPAFLKFSNKKKETKKVKMLNQDGQLVEIDASNIPATKKKIKSNDIHTWVNKKVTSLN